MPFVSAMSRIAPARLRLIPALDREPAFVARAQTRIGRAVLAASMGFLCFGSEMQLLAVALAALVAYLPNRRAITMPLATIGLSLLFPMVDGVSAPVVALFLIVSAGVIVIARRVGRRGAFSRPVIALLTLVFILAGIGCLPGLPESVRTAIWSAAAVITALKWFLAYAIVNATGRKPAPLGRTMAMLHPFWGSTTTPFGKGAAFIAKFEAHDPEALAITQLKAVKLMLWAKWLWFTQIGFNIIIYDKLHVPTLTDAIAAHAAGAGPGRLMAIASVPANFLASLLSLAVTGHTIISIARFSGFRLPRNTVNPLAARSIAEFWNRYYYYFKELLVDFFFMPTFVRLSGWAPRTRLLAATFAAAGLGNYLFHFTRDISYMRDLGAKAAISGSATYAFYCFLLSAGIACSQLLSGASITSVSRMPVWLTRVGVLGFYCFVSIFNYEGRTLSLASHVDFLRYIFGLT